MRSDPRAATVGLLLDDLVHDRDIVVVMVQQLISRHVVLQVEGFGPLELVPLPLHLHLTKGRGRGR